MNRLSTLRRLSMAAIWGPPPCTTTGLMPSCQDHTFKNQTPMQYESVLTMRRSNEPGAATLSSRQRTNPYPKA
jgi:hypothetical protein